MQRLRPRHVGRGQQVRADGMRQGSRHVVVQLAQLLLEGHEVVSRLRIVVVVLLKLLHDLHY